ncbi:MAG: hypothetical protein GY856_44290 [bacterium]|nr:hypothetical protein [bacterium]
MKIQSVEANHRRKVFEIAVGDRVLTYPYAKLDPGPTARNKVVLVYVDEEIDLNGFTYVLASGDEGTVHIEQVLEYHRDPGYLRDLLLYRLTLEAQQRVEASGLSKREIISRLGTSASQFYHLLDQTNYRKSLGQLLALLYVLDCEVDLVVRARKSA